MTTQDYRKKGVLAIFLSYFKPHKKLFFLDLGCALLSALIDLSYPLLSRYAMQDLLPVSAFGTFFTVMAILVVAFCLRAVLFYVLGYWGHTFGIRVEADIRKSLFGHLQTLGFDFFSKNRTGKLMSRMTTDLFDLTELAHHGPEDLIIAVLTIFGALGILFTIEWRLTLVIAILIPVALLLVMSRRRSMGKASRRVKERSAEITAEIESSLSGMRTAKAFANEDVEKEKFDRANTRYKNSKREFHREMGLFQATMEFFLSLLSVAVIAVGGWLIMQKKMDYIDLITFSMYTASFVSPIRKIAHFSEMFANGFAGLNRFVDIMRTEPQLQDAPDARDLVEVRGEIGIHKVTFAYGENPDVLRDVTLTGREDYVMST